MQQQQPVAKHAMGSSLAKVSLDEVEAGATHAFACTVGSTFDVRQGPSYEKTGKKAKSEENMCEVVGVDVFKSNRKLTHIMEHVIPPEDLTKPLTSTTDFVYVPQLFVVNFMLPSYNPSNPLWGASVSDGRSYSIVMYIKILPEAVEAIKNDSYPAATLLKNFFQMDTKSNEDYLLRGRLKAIPVLLNPDSVNLGMALKSMVRSYDAKPFLTGPKYHSFIKTDLYLECDVDIHDYVYPARKTLFSLLPEVPSMLIDFGLLIEGQGDEMPERMLASIRLSRIDPAKAIDIELPPITK